MKIRFCAALLLAALAIPIFTGCAASAVQQLDIAEDAIENRLDAVEDAIESRVEAVMTDTPTPMASAPAVLTTPTTPATLPAPTASAALLSKEEAEKIALEHAGFTADQVQRLRTELDYDRGKPEYEVDFHVDRFEYDYEIDAETGNILSYDKDFDD